MKHIRILTAAGIIALCLGALLNPVNADKPFAPAAQGASGTTGTSTEKTGYTRPSEAELRARLTPLQFDVTQKEATERPFNNEYWDNKRAGIYVDIVSGQPLFSSLDKYKSGTGWPSFTRPIAESAMSTHTDTRFFQKRTELKSSLAGSHLGHLFDDGPQPTGKRYCINSASLRFIPKEKLAEEGYEDFLPLLKR